MFFHHDNGPQTGPGNGPASGRVSPCGAEVQLAKGRLRKVDGAC